MHLIHMIYFLWSLDSSLIYRTYSRDITGNTIDIVKSQIGNGWCICIYVNIIIKAAKVISEQKGTYKKRSYSSLCYNTTARQCFVKNILEAIVVVLYHSTCVPSSLHPCLPLLSSLSSHSLYSPFFLLLCLCLRPSSNNQWALWALWALLTLQV